MDEDDPPLPDPETCDHSKFRPVQKMRCYICGGCRRVLDRREATILVTAWEMFP